MVIDPRLYEKVSGKKGDPYERAALAGANLAGKRGLRSKPGDRSITERLAIGHLRAHWWWSIFISILVFIGLVAAMVN